MKQKPGRHSFPFASAFAVALRDRAAMSLRSGFSAKSTPSLQPNSASGTIKDGRRQATSLPCLLPLTASSPPANSSAAFNAGYDVTSASGSLLFLCAKPSRISKPRSCTPPSLCYLTSSSRTTRSLSRTTCSRFSAVFSAVCSELYAAQGGLGLALGPVPRERR